MTERAPSRRRVIGGLGASAFVAPTLATARGLPRWRGFNLVETAGAPFGSAAAATALRQVRATGARAVALIPFLWQRAADDPRIVLGDTLPPDRLRAGIAQARAAGLAAILKPHVWVPGGWAGAVRMRDATGWGAWFAAYRAALVPLARLAQDAGAAGFVVGTELSHSVTEPYWPTLIAAVRGAFRGPIGYVAHGADEAERVRFWRSLDAVGATLYPPLGDPGDPAAWRHAMAVEAGRVAAVARRAGRPLWIGEIGLRSAEGATEKPWESAEERAAPADPALQARVIATWLDVLAPLDPAALLVWRWFSDPGIGGPADTDFTVQGKPAADAIGRVWGPR